MRHRTKLITVAFWLFTAVPLLAGDFDAGRKAFQSGDIATALEEWWPLANAGDRDAQHALGRMYEYGHGFARDDAQAAFWYEKAAEQNLAEAQYRLGVLHDNGWGVERESTVAAKWYLRAATLGHVFAQHDLAFMHLIGSGVPRDKVQAYKWLKIAAAQRADLMSKHLLNVSRTMTADEIEKAERLAADWLTSEDL